MQIITEASDGTLEEWDGTLNEWDGTQSYRGAACSMYRFDKKTRCELAAAFAQVGNPDATLPEEIWPDLEAALSRHRAFVEDARWDKPCAKTRTILGKLEERLRRDVEDLEGLLMNGASLAVLGHDFEFWATLLKTLESGLPMLASYQAEMEGHVTSKGPDVAVLKSQQATMMTVQNILIRNGLSLITAGVSTKKLYREAFLARFFALAQDAVGENRTPRLIRTIGGQGRVVFPTIE